MKVQQTQSLTLTVLLGLASPSYFASARASSSTSTPSLRQHTRIINGTTAEADRYNYFVSFQSISFQNKTALCGGSLVAADVVLTAAHCEIPDLRDSWAVIKRHDLNDISEGTVILVEGSPLPHPNYDFDSTKYDNDFMLLFLRDPAPQDAAFVKLNSDPNVPAAGDYVTVMGHGDTEFNGTSSMELLEVEINAVSNEECQESYRSNFTDNMLCAADIGEDSCQGDSGGPLVIKGNDAHGSDDIQVGVVSWGTGCAHPEYAGVYARVSSAFDWIRQEVCARSKYPPAEFDCDYIISVPTFTPTLEPTFTLMSEPTITMAPTVSCPPPYNSSLTYDVGDRVNFGEQIFICQPQDGSERCADDSSVWYHVKACCPPAFDDAKTDYQAYDKVSSDGIIFQCQPGPYEEYCNIHIDIEDWGWNETEWDLYNNSWSIVGEC